MTTAFLYKWVQKSTNMWYVGSRTAKGCHVNDGYICSSKYVKPMILENKNDWIRIILAIGSSEYIRKLETAYLQSINAKVDQTSYNRSNADGTFLNTSGVNNPMFGKCHTAESRKKMSLAGKGKKRSLEARNNISKAHIGITNGPCSIETKAKISAAKKGKVSPKKGIPTNAPSIATRLKLSEANKNYKPTTATIAKIKATIAANKMRKIFAVNMLAAKVSADLAESTTHDVCVS